jgi:hypothetical protein
MLDEYYQLRNWDVETGIPRNEKLHQLGLGYTVPVAEEMRKKEIARLRG